MQDAIGTSLIDCALFATNSWQVFLTVFDLANRVREDMEDDQEMINALQFGQLVIDWTDPTKLIEV